MPGMQYHMISHTLVLCPLHALALLTLEFAELFRCGLGLDAAYFEGLPPSDAV